MKTGNLILAMRYAKAFDGMAKNTDEALHNFTLLENCLEEIKEIAPYLQNPTLSEQFKIDLIEKGLTKNIASSFLLVLVREKRFNLISQIIKEINNLLDKRCGIKRANITTADVLDKETQSKIQRALEEYFKTKLTLDFKEDKGLISGLKIKVGDFYIEDSSSSRLRELENVLRE